MVVLLSEFVNLFVEGFFAELLHAEFLLHRQLRQCGIRPSIVEPDGAAHARRLFFAL